MGLICLLADHLLRCRSRHWLHPRSGLLFSCFYIASLWLQRFLKVGRWRVVFALSSICVWRQRPWRSRQIILLPLGFLHVHLLEFEGLSKSVISWIYFSESHFGSSKVSSQFWVLYGCVIEPYTMNAGVIPL